VRQILVRQTYMMAVALCLIVSWAWMSASVVGAEPDAADGDFTTQDVTCAIWADASKQSATSILVQSLQSCSGNVAHQTLDVDLYKCSAPGSGTTCNGFFGKYRDVANCQMFSAGNLWCPSGGSVQGSLPAGIYRSRASGCSTTTEGTRGCGLDWSVRIRLP